MSQCQAMVKENTCNKKKESSAVCIIRHIQRLSRCGTEKLAKTRMVLEELLAELGVADPMATVHLGSDRHHADRYCHDEERHEPLLILLIRSGHTRAVTACLEAWSGYPLDFTRVGASGETVWHCVAGRSLSDHAAESMLSALVRRLQRCPEDCVCWSQTDKIGEDFLCRAAAHQRLSLFWRHVASMPYFADCLTPWWLPVVWRWDIEAVLAMSQGDNTDGLIFSWEGDSEEEEEEEVEDDALAPVGAGGDHPRRLRALRGGGDRMGGGAQVIEADAATGLLCRLTWRLRSHEGRERHRHHCCASSSSSEPCYNCLVDMLNDDADDDEEEDWLGMRMTMDRALSSGVAEEEEEPERLGTAPSAAASAVVVDLDDDDGVCSECEKCLQKKEREGENNNNNNNKKTREKIFRDRLSALVQVCVRRGAAVDFFDPLSHQVLLRHFMYYGYVEAARHCLLLRLPGPSSSSPPPPPTSGMSKFTMTAQTDAETARFPTLSIGIDLYCESVLHCICVGEACAWELVGLLQVVLQRRELVPDDRIDFLLPYPDGEGETTKNKRKEEEEEGEEVKEEVMAWKRRTSPLWSRLRQFLLTAAENRWLGVVWTLLQPVIDRESPAWRCFYPIPLSTPALPRLHPSDDEDHHGHHDHHENTPSPSRSLSSLTLPSFPVSSVGSSSSCVVRPRHAAAALCRQGKRRNRGCRRRWKFCRVSQKRGSGVLWSVRIRRTRVKTRKNEERESSSEGRQLRERGDRILVAPEGGTPFSTSSSPSSSSSYSCPRLEWLHRFLLWDACQVCAEMGIHQWDPRRMLSGLVMEEGESCADSALTAAAADSATELQRLGVRFDTREWETVY